MGRSAFKSRPAPFSDRDDVQLRDDAVFGPSSFFNPTRARFDHVPSAEEKHDDVSTRPQFQWRSRDNRKGRHTLVIPADGIGQHLPAPTASSRAVVRGIGRMFTSFPWWDVSFLVAFFFSIGCAIFIICGLFYWLPIAYPSTEFPHESGTAGGVTAFVGGTLFTIGAVLLVVEATNENQTGCFGWELEQVFSEHTHPKDGEDASSSPRNLSYRPKRWACKHAHCPVHSRSPFKGGPHAKNQARKWEWWPTWHELRTHYFHEIGFLGSFIEFLGAAIFYINCILALPGVYPHLSQGVLWGVYWLTYLVGGVLFIVASGLYMLETQPNWYTPAPHVLGWHVGLWNMIGSVGWTLAAALGYCDLSVSSEANPPILICESGSYTDVLSRAVSINLT